jgi:hypothetical protein
LPVLIAASAIECFLPSLRRAALAELERESLLPLGKILPPNLMRLLN